MRILREAFLTEIQQTIADQLSVDISSVTTNIPEESIDCSLGNHHNALIFLKISFKNISCLLNFFFSNDINHKCLE